MAKITLRVGLPKRDDLKPAIAKALAAVGEAAVTIIRQRTGKGLDSTGRPFKPYGEDYRLARIASGRSGTPNLLLTGELLNNLKRLRVTPKGVVIGWDKLQHRASHFGAASKKAFVSDRATRQTTGKRTLKRDASTVLTADLVQGLHEDRPFFEIVDAKEIAQLTRVFFDTLETELKKSIRK